jgi:hypothetical protein
VQRESGAGDRLLRPLCAKKLPETLPEREGWVNRDKLFDFHGRGRKPQIALARQYEIEDYAQPAGGCCFLTDAAYSDKLVDLWKARGDRDYELDDIMLLKVGRHVRPAPHFKIIISREEGENRFLEGYRKQYISLYPSSHSGPLGLIDGAATEADLELAARVISRYSKGRDGECVTVIIQFMDGEQKQVDVTPMRSDEIPQTWYV